MKQKSKGRALLIFDPAPIETCKGSGLSVGAQQIISVRKMRRYACVVNPVNSKSDIDKDVAIIESHLIAPSVTGGSRFSNFFALEDALKSDTPFQLLLSETPFNIM